MSLFGDVRPKGITKEELTFIKSELLNGEHHLSQEQTERVLEELHGYMDTDHARHPEWKQIEQAEVTEIAHDLPTDHALHLTPEQDQKVATILQKYVDISRHKSLF
jgi:hypothetical protein